MVKRDNVYKGFRVLASSFLLASALGLVTSCGIETIATLPTPTVADFNLQSDFSKLSFAYNSSVYSGLDYFSGFLVYYKISPLTTGPFDTLTSDRDTLATSPTIYQLQSLGYNRVQWESSASNGSRVQLATDTPSTSPRVPIELNNPFVGEVFVLDFGPVLPGASGIYKEPLIFEGSSSPSANLFRAPNVAPNQPDDLFSSFLNSSYLAGFSAGRPTDVYQVSTDPLSPNTYQIEFFLVAFGLTGDLTSVYSNPAPWGVIRPLGQ